MEEKKVLSSEEFKEICKEAMPHIEALKDILGKRDIKSLGSLTFCADGYLNFEIYDTGWEVIRTSKDDKVRIRHEYKMEVDI